MLFRAPATLPPLAELMRNTGARPRDVARYLGATERTVWNWLAGGPVPRAALLALYWDSHEGRGLVSSALQVEAAHYYHRAVAAEAQNEKLRRHIALLEQHSVFPSANSPSYLAP